jgi:hypothetical protein
MCGWNASVFWIAGDHIAIASSSILGTDAEERVVGSTSYDSALNRTRLALTEPLSKTHLGEVITHGHNTLDMRAEVREGAEMWGWEK